MSKYIFHVDMDAFFASVEELDKPWLKDKPMIVGGRSNRGVATTANYEARKYGLHSAMPIFQAKKLCPQVIIIPADKEKYSQYSNKIHNILINYSKTIERVSLDEAYMEFNYLNNPITMAKEIKKEVKAKTGLTMSVGISYNKFLAKLASDWNKPDGITMIEKDMVPEILMDLHISKIHGLGSQSIARLENIGIEKVSDLYLLSEDFLIDFFGIAGSEIFYRIRGIDNRKVEPIQKRKSLGTENTFLEDTSSIEELKEILKTYSAEVSRDLVRKGLMGKTFTVKLKNNKFQSKSRSMSLVEYTDEFETINNTGQKLLEELYDGSVYRLMGLTASNLVEANFKQLSLFEGL